MSPRSDREEVDALRAENEELRAALAVHERERAALHHQQAALRTVIASIPYCVWWKDVNSAFLGCNERFAALAGRKPAEMIGLTDYDMPWKKSESDQFREDDRLVLESAQPKVDIEETLADAEGREKVLLTAKVPLRDDDGNIIGTLGTFTDITARKAMERELAKAKEHAEAASNAKSEFLATVSHELRTPLALVLGPLESLRSHPGLPEEVRADVDRVHRNAWRLKGLVDDILDYAKAEAGKLVPVLDVVPIDELVAAVVDDIRPAAAARGLTLTLEPSPARDVRALVDHGMLEKIVLNLVGNALKFTPAGGTVVVSIAVPGDQIELSVRDTGIGISDEHQSLLFRRFQQVDASTKRRYEGTGLGLALVKEFAEQMGGSVSVSSRLGEGSRFVVMLPLPSARELENRPGKAAASDRTADASLARLLPLDAVHPASASSSSSPVSSSTRDRPCVLLAEDHADLRAYITSLLDGEYDVIACANGAEALAAIERRAPHVIVSDVMMPEVDGHELVARVKADARFSHIPIILLTAQVGREVLVSSLQRGADDFLNKPFSPAELRARVSVAMRLHESQCNLVRKNEELVQTRDMLVEAEKLAALGRLLAQLSHEINNPMCVIIGNLPVLEEYLETFTIALRETRDAAKSLSADGSPLMEAIEAIRAKYDVDFLVSDFADGLRAMGEAAKRVGGIQDDLRAFLRGQPVEKSASNLNDALRLTVDVLRRGLPPDVRIGAEYGELPALPFNSGQLKQVFLNLLRNAVDAVGKRGDIQIATRATKEAAIVTITDSGAGIPEEIRPRIFEPFFSTKDVHGSGLGLAVCHQIVDGHGGTLRLDDSYCSGARFVIELPLDLGRTT